VIRGDFYIHSTPRDMQYLTCGQLCERSVYSILISPLDLLVAFIAESLDGDRDNSFMSTVVFLDLGVCLYAKECMC
jgi:hypothetical protein